MHSALNKCRRGRGKRREEESDELFIRHSNYPKRDQRENSNPCFFVTKLFERLFCWRGTRLIIRRFASAQRKWLTIRKWNYSAVSRHKTEKGRRRKVFSVFFPSFLWHWSSSEREKLLLSLSSVEWRIRCIHSELKSFQFANKFQINTTGNLLASAPQTN